MTQPDITTSTGGVSELITDGAKEIIAQAKRFGLTWDLRLARVTEGDAPSNITAVLDGDLTPISMVSLIGKIPVNTRVYVIAVPPSGYFIIGWTGPPQQLRADG